jgi:hypothetical protein
VRPYSTRAWDELARMQLTPPEIVWGGFALGGSCVIFGQGGLGKSRFALNLARNQVLGIPFAGIPTAPRPLRHLMMGSENSIHRLQSDVRRMARDFPRNRLQRWGSISAYCNAGRAGGFPYLPCIPVQRDAVGGDAGRIPAGCPVG